MPDQRRPTPSEVVVAALWWPILRLVAIVLLIFVALVPGFHETVSHWSLVLAVVLGVYFVRSDLFVLTSVAVQKARAKESTDFKWARNAAGRPGRVISVGGRAGWTDVGGDPEAEWEPMARRVAGELAKLLRRDHISPDLARFICFKEARAFRDYSSVYYGKHGTAVAAYYVSWPVRKIVMCHELSARLPGTPQGVLAHELTHLAVRPTVEADLPSWLDEGLASLVARRTTPGTSEPGTATRILRLARAKDQLLSGSKLVGMNRTDLWMHLAQWQEYDHFWNVVLFYIQSALLVEFLSDLSPAGFPTLIDRALEGDEPDLCERHFDITADDAMETAISDLLSGEPAPHEKLPADMRHRLERDLISRSRDDFLAEDDRILAIRSMGGIGYLESIDALNEIIETGDGRARSEARRAIECIRGQPLEEAAPDLPAAER